MNYSSRLALQILLWICCTAITALTIVTTAWNRWSELGSADPFNQANPWAGLWYQCDTQLSPKVLYTCYRKFDGNTTYIWLRILMVTACVCSCIATLSLMFFMECAACTRYDYQMKNIIIIVSAICYILAGILMEIVCSLDYFKNRGKASNLCLVRESLLFSDIKDFLGYKNRPFSRV